jgi:hypothetical protein
MIASVRIEQSEALRIHGRESTANPPTQSFALRNPGVNRQFDRKSASMIFLSLLKSGNT